jgi:hypothetical protein
MRTTRPTHRHLVARALTRVSTPRKRTVTRQHIQPLGARPAMRGSGPRSNYYTVDGY